LPSGRRAAADAGHFLRLGRPAVINLAAESSPWRPVGHAPDGQSNDRALTLIANVLQDFQHLAGTEPNGGK